MYEMLKDFVIYVAVVFLATSLGTQILKKYFRAITIRKFSLKSLTQDGGFPSSHTAFSISWTVIAIFVTVHLFLEGEAESTLLLALVISMIAVGNMCVIIRDALGVRRTVQILCDAVKKSAESNNEFLSNVEIENFDNETTIKIQKNFEDIAKRMNIKSGHLPHEVIGGAFWGTLVTGAISSHYFGLHSLMIAFIVGIVIYILTISIFIRYSTTILNLISNIFEIVKRLFKIR